MDTQLLSTVGHFEVSQGGEDPRIVHRELAMHQDIDGSWVVYAVHPGTVDDAGEDMVSGSLRVKDPQHVALIGDLVAMLADPAGFAARQASRLN